MSFTNAARRQSQATTTFNADAYLDRVWKSLRQWA